MTTAVRAPARVLTRAEIRESMDRRRAASLWVPCGFCRAKIGEPCRTTSGRLVVGRYGDNPAHGSRWDRIRREYERPRRYRLRDDDPTFNLAKGDILICEPYWLDPEKVTVLYRESDHYDPSCNQYRAAVEMLRGTEGVTDPAEVRKVMDKIWPAWRPYRA